MTGYCPNCDETRELRTERRRETYMVRDEPIEVEADVLVCSTCGQAVFDEKRDERTLRAAYDVYRARKGLLKPDEIRELRERYGLSQRSLARLLGWGLVTVQRYERGALQDKSHDDLLRALEDPSFVLELLDRHGDRLPERVRQAVRSAALGAAALRYPVKLAREVERAILVDYHRRPDLHGLRAFDLERLEQLVVYLARRCPGAFKTKMAKLLWLADFGHFRLHRVSITGLAYARYPYGPAPDHFASVMAALEELGTVRVVEGVAGPYQGEVVEAVQEESLDEFAEAERRTIDWVVARFGRMVAAELSRLSHAEPSWAERADGDLIPYAEADRIRMLDGLEAR
ncbi:type II TA system antitoxin MqsA family protein [Carboxydochorda subterranea]|uniref:Type II TA system antitoxin MqsA family protein n=1 Tax=Carboxydichorda subterranea TaxID=3109565 RepID=A0ABZ1C188_9FIRM|nr:type II TA system antitoxin MqsA family protein [Limnochorda sp. L945t]WRP18866.1 type II TA system antitoxin MqsA family protein [Limnochorda sp. L945t]